MTTVCFEKSIWLLERCPHGKTHSIVQVLNTSPEKEENIYFNIQLSGTKYIHRVPKPVFRVLAKHGEGIMEKEKLYDSGQVRWSKNYRGLKTFLGLVFSWPVASVACELWNTNEAQQKCTGDKNRHRAITYTNTLIISIQCVKRGSQAICNLFVANWGALSHLLWSILWQRWSPAILSPGIHTLEWSPPLERGQGL